MGVVIEAMEAAEAFGESATASAVVMKIAFGIAMIMAIDGIVLMLVILVNGIKIG